MPLEGVVLLVVDDGGSAKGGYPRTIVTMALVAPEIKKNVIHGCSCMKSPIDAGLRRRPRRLNGWWAISLTFCAVAGDGGWSVE